MKSERQTKRKPHGVPPPPSWLAEKNGGPFAIGVLGELNGTLALALWRAVRFVTLWAAVPQGRRFELRPRPSPEREQLCSDAGGQVPELREPVALLFNLFSDPGECSEAAVAEACETLHVWATHHGYRETALHFAEAAAFTDSANPRYANVAGAACRRAGLMSRATIWIIRARKLAVTNVTERIRSLLAMGAVMKETGRLAEAEAAFTRAAAAAARKNRKRQAAEAHHDLLLLTAEQGRLHDVEHHASRAVDLYPRSHARLPYLAHDLAFALVRHGYYGNGRALLDLFVRTVPPAELLPGLSTLAWALAGEGLVQRFDEVGDRVRSLATLDHEYAAASYLHLAEGARVLGRWERASRDAALATEAATLRKDPTLLIEAHALAEAIQRRDPPHPPRETLSPRLDRLSRYLTARLKPWKSPPS